MSIEIVTLVASIFTSSTDLKLSIFTSPTDLKLWLIRLSSTNKGHFQVCCSLCWQQLAQFMKCCYCCHTDSAWESKVLILCNCAVTTIFLVYMKINFIFATGIVQWELLWPVHPHCLVNKSVVVFPFHWQNKGQIQVFMCRTTWGSICPPCHCEDIMVSHWFKSVSVMW